MKNSHFISCLFLRVFLAWILPKPHPGFPSSLRSKRFHRLSLSIAYPSPSACPSLPNSPLFLSPFRNPFRHHIQFQTLLPGNSLLLHMVIPRANLKQQPLRAGIKALPARLIQPREPILPQEHDTISPVHSLAQNLLLLSRDSSTHQHATTFGWWRSSPNWSAACSTRTDTSTTSGWRSPTRC